MLSFWPILPPPWIRRRRINGVDTLSLRLHYQLSNPGSIFPFKLLAEQSSTQHHIWNVIILTSDYLLQTTGEEVGGAGGYSIVIWTRAFLKGTIFIFCTAHLHAFKKKSCMVFTKRFCEFVDLFPNKLSNICFN